MVERLWRNILNSDADGQVCRVYSAHFRQNIINDINCKNQIHCSPSTSSSRFVFSGLNLMKGECVHMEETNVPS